MKPRKACFALGLFFLTVALPAQAITFIPSKKPDPFAAGKMCDTPELGSMGSYVYAWPSKYDLVFSPWDYSQFTWRCPDSGYVALAPDFEVKDAAVKSRIAEYLSKAVYRPVKDQPRDEAAEIAHMDAINVVRNMPPDRMAHRLRLFAWMLAQDPKADTYRKRAMTLHEALLAKGELKGFDLAETLYILGFYSRKFGDPAKSKEYFDRLRAMPAPDDQKDQLAYLNGLAKEVEEGKGDDAVRFKSSE